ncbi:hypothetical protein V6N11_057076 [Hibiscus sabdariffa]|uniref:Uncharacterized protein n=1 Tax=Hibiscus sabdariffa TaxID=183260 RepID=A0ABR1ZVS6_9ROSI
MKETETHPMAVYVETKLEASKLCSNAPSATTPGGAQPIPFVGSPALNSSTCMASIQAPPQSQILEQCPSAAVPIQFSNRLK